MARLIILVVFIALIALARKSKPAGNKIGHELNDSTKLSLIADRIVVASYNIQTGKDLNGRRNLKASAEVVANADLVGIQEVYAPSLANLVGLGLSQTETLAKHSGFAWLFSATRRRWLREHRGNAILSKLAISDWRVAMLSDQSRKSFRNMAIAEVHWQSKSFHFINTHLHTRGGREEQLLEVLQEFAKYPRAILVGDFNSRASTPALANALKDVEICDAVTVAGLDTDNTDRIDWILTKGFKVESGEILEKGVSDHPYYQVTLSYK